MARGILKNGVTLATHHIPLSVEALDHEQLRIDRVNKAFVKSPTCFDPARLPSLRMWSAKSFVPCSQVNGFMRGLSDRVWADSA
jgi:hypothetical protein